MPRPISINKSNFFILSGNITDDELRDYIVKKYSNKIYNRMFDYTFEQYQTFIKHQSRKAVGELVQIIDKNHDEIALDEYLQQDYDKSFPIHYLKFIEVIAYYCSFSKDAIIKDSIRLEESGRQSDKETIEFALNYFEKKIKDKIFDSWLDKVDSSRFEISELFHKEVPKLIKGYSRYLELLSNENKSKNKICDEIEFEYLNSKVHNVRQEFARYDGYFTKMENYLNIKLLDETKVFLLKRSYDLVSV